jgi:hypothetical protein
MTKRIKLWFDGVPLIEIGPLANDVLNRGWEYEHSVAGQWWAEFLHDFPDEAAFDTELEALKAIFGKRWTLCELGTVTR